MHILLYDLGHAAPEDHVVPVGMVRHLRTVLQRIATLCRSQTDASDGHALVHVSHLGFLPDITYQHYLVHSIQFLN